MLIVESLQFLSNEKNINQSSVNLELKKLTNNIYFD